MQHSSGALLQGSSEGALGGIWERSPCLEQCAGADGCANIARQVREPASTVNTSAQTTNARAWEASQPCPVNRNVAEDRITAAPSSIHPCVQRHLRRQIHVVKNLPALNQSGWKHASRLCKLRQKQHVSRLFSARVGSG